MREYVDVAEATAKKNLDGRLVVKATVGLPFLLEEGISVWFVPPRTDAPRHVSVRSVSLLDDARATVAFCGVDDARTAEMLVGCHCLVDAADLAEEVSELIRGEGGAQDALCGWAFEDAASGFVGVVVESEVIAGRKYLHVASSEGGDVHMVPFAEDFVVSVDESARALTMSCPKGMFDL